MNAPGLGAGNPPGFQNYGQMDYRQKQALHHQRMQMSMQQTNALNQQRQPSMAPQMVPNPLMFPTAAAQGFNNLMAQWPSMQQGTMDMSMMLPMPQNFRSYQPMAANLQMNVPNYMGNFNGIQHQQMMLNAHGLNFQEQQPLDLRQTEMQQLMMRQSVMPMVQNPMFQVNPMAVQQLQTPNQIASIPQHLPAQRPQQNLQAEPQQLLPAGFQIPSLQEEVDTPPPILTRQNSQEIDERQMAQAKATWQVPSDSNHVVSAPVLATALNELAKAPVQPQEVMEKKASLELRTVPFDTPGTSTTAETPGPRDLPTPHEVKTDLPSSTEKAKQHCRKCANHNEKVLRVGHFACPHADCKCPACLETEKVRQYCRNHYHQRREFDKHRDSVPVAPVAQELSLKVGQQQMKMDPMLLTPSSSDSDHAQRMNTSFEKPSKADPMDMAQQFQWLQMQLQQQQQQQLQVQQIQQQQEHQQIQQLGIVLGKRIKEEVEDVEVEILSHTYGGTVVDHDHPIVKKPKVEVPEDDQNELQNKKVKKEVVSEESEQKVSALAALEAKFGQNMQQAAQGFQGPSQAKMEPPHTYQVKQQNQMQPNAFAPHLQHFPGTWPPHTGQMETFGTAAPQSSSFGLQQQQQQFLQLQEPQQHHLQMAQQMQQSQQIQQKVQDPQSSSFALQQQHFQQPSQIQEPQCNQIPQQQHLQMSQQMAQPQQAQQYVQEQIQPIQQSQNEVRQSETVLQSLIDENEAPRQKETAVPPQIIQDQGFSCAPQPMKESSSQMSIDRQAMTSAETSSAYQNMPFSSMPSTSTSSDEKGQVAPDPTAAEPQPAPPLVLRYAHQARERFYIPESPMPPPPMETDDSDEPEEDETPMETDQEPCCSSLTTKSSNPVNPEFEDIFRGLGTPPRPAEPDEHPGSPDCSGNLEDSGIGSDAENEEDDEVAQKIEELVASSSRPAQPKVYKRPLPRFELLKNKGVPQKEWGKWCLTCLAHKSSKKHQSQKDCFFRRCVICPRESLCHWSKQEFKHALDLWQTEQMERLGSCEEGPGEEVVPTEKKTKKAYCVKCRAHRYGKRDVTEHICPLKNCRCKDCLKALDKQERKKSHKN